jgi:hypothetical protein
MLKCIAYGLRNVEVYWGKCYWGLYRAEAISTQLDNTEAGVYHFGAIDLSENDCPTTVIKHASGKIFYLGGKRKWLKLNM